ncbi:MAG: hypothetical protein AAGF26_11880 [Cyanobacteria bacterium P01_G01_bin.49]
MTAAPDYLSTTFQYRRPRKSANSRRGHQISTTNRTKVTRLPKRSRQLPLALQFLLLVQKSSTTLTCGLVAITLAVYGWTVYAPTLWSREFSKLKTLQRDERQLVSTNETIKHKMAQKAEQPGSGLTQPNPNQSLFVPPADSPKIEVRVNAHSPEEEPLLADSFVSY